MPRPYTVLTESHIHVRAVANVNEESLSKQNQKHMAITHTQIQCNGKEIFC